MILDETLEQKLLENFEMVAGEGWRRSVGLDGSCEK